MGKHAVIGNSQVGRKNQTLKSGAQYAAAARVRDAAAMAGPVHHSQGEQSFSDTAMALTIALATRSVTDMTYRMSDYRKDGTKWALNMRSLGGRIVCRRVATKTFTGWVAEFMPYTGGRVSLAKIAKGNSIDHNGESEDCRRAALVNLHSALIKIAAR